MANHSSKGDLYVLIKDNFGLENYLIKQWKEVSRYITYLRKNNHKLPIQDGRCLNTDRSERICQHCEDKFIEEIFTRLLS